MKLQLSIWRIILWKHKWDNAHHRGEHEIATTDIESEMSEAETSTEAQCC